MSQLPQTRSFCEELHRQQSLQKVSKATPLSSPQFNKWRQPTRNIQPGDLVVIREDSPIAIKWPLARIVEVYPGKDKLVRVALVKTANGVYTRPVNKLAVVLPSDEQSLVEHFPPISVV